MVSFRTQVRRSTKGAGTDAWHLLREHGEELAIAAREVLAQCPDARIAGIIVQPNAQCGSALRALLWRNRGARSEERTCVGIVERSALAQQFAHDLDHLVVVSAMSSTADHALPVLVATPEALRCCSIGAVRNAPRVVRR